MENAYTPLTLAQLQTPEGALQLNNMLQKLMSQVAGDGNNVRIYYGYGSPEGAVQAGVGSLFMRLDGGVNTACYIKQTGTGATGWTAVSVPTIDSLLPSQSGKNNNFLTTDGTNCAWGQPYQNIQVFISSGTFTKPTGISKVFVEVCGGGGAGGGGGSTGGKGSHNYMGGCGGGGGYSCKVCTITGNVTVTIGGAGGESSFGSDVHAHGGGAGSSYSGGSGATASYDGDLSCVGQGGHDGDSNTSASGGTSGGSGGGNHYIGGGVNSGSAGGAGSGGIVIVRW